MAAVTELGSERGLAAAIAAVGHGPTLVAVDAAGAAVRPAITWQDTRPQRTSPDDPDGVAGFTLRPAIRWLAVHEPEVIARSQWLLNTWDWVAFRLTGIARSSLQPGEAPLAVGEAPADARLAPTVGVGTRIGGITANAALELGLSPSAVVVAGTNDGAATIVGAGAHEIGEAVDVGGASGGVAVIAGESRSLPGTYCAPSLYPGRWMLGGAMMAIGASMTWLRTAVLGDRWTIEELLHEAADVPPGSDGLVFLPYLAGERSPIWDAEARGVFCGLREMHTRAHLVRAVLEGGAFALRDVLAPLRESGVALTELRLAGRPALSPLWSQIKSDVLGVPVVAPVVTEAAVLGAAAIAAVGAGLVADLAAAATAMRGERARFLPREDVQARYDRGFAVYRSLYPALRPAFHALAEL